MHEFETLNNYTVNINSMDYIVKRYLKVITKHLANQLCYEWFKNKIILLKSNYVHSQHKQYELQSLHKYEIILLKNSYTVNINSMNYITENNLKVNTQMFIMNSLRKNDLLKCTLHVAMSQIM